MREVIGQRLNRLSEQCNQTLVTAAIIGREFDFRLLRVLSDGLSENQLLEAIDEGLEAHLIGEITRGLERYQFSHALIQETLSEELSISRKVRLHARISEALEEIFGADVEAHAAELAYRFAEAATVPGIEKLVHYSLLAGKRALATFAYEEAIGHYERALAVKEQQQIDEEQAVLLFGLAQARLATWGRFQTQETREIVTILRRVFDFFAEVGDLDRAVTVAEHPVRTSLGVVIGEAELITAALALVPSDSHAAGRLLSTYGLILYQEKGDYQGAQEAFGQALEIAKRAQDTALEMRTLAYTADVDFFHLHWQECLEKGQRAIKLSGRVEDLHAQAVSGFFMARILDYLGDSNGAGEQVEALLARAERLRNRDWLGEGLYIAGVLFLHQGDWQRSRDFIDRALRTPRPSAPHLCARAMLDYQPGDFDQGQYHVDRLVEATPRSALGTGFA